MSTDEPLVNPPLRAAGAWRRWFQFRLRSILILVTVFAVVAAIAGRQIYLQQRYAAALAAIKESGGQTSVASGDAAAKGDAVKRVLLTGITNEQLRQLAPHLQFLPELERLDIVDSEVNDEGLQQLQDLIRLKRLYLYNTKTTTDGLAWLGERLPELEIKQEMPNPIATGLAMRPIYQTAVTALEASSDGRWLAAGDGHGRLWLWRLDERGLPDDAPRSAAAHEDWLFDAAFSADGQLLATGGGDNRIVVWDVETLLPKFELTGHDDDVHAVAFALDDQKLVSTSDDMTVRVWDLASRETDHGLEGHSDTIPCLAVSPDGETAASGSRDGDIRLWNVASGALTGVLKGHDGDVMSVAYQADGATLVSASYDKTIRVWPLNQNEQPHKLTGHFDWVFAVAVANDGRIVSGGGDETLRLWEADAGRALVVREQTGNISRIVAIPKRGLVAAANAEGQVQFWDESLGERLQVVDLGI